MNSADIEVISKHYKFVFILAATVSVSLFILAEFTIFERFSVGAKYLLFLCGTTFIAWFFYLLYRAKITDVCEKGNCLVRFVYICIASFVSGILLSILTAVGSQRVIYNLFSSATIVRAFVYCIVTFLTVTISEEIVAWKLADVLLSLRSCFVTKLSKFSRYCIKHARFLVVALVLIFVLSYVIAAALGYVVLNVFLFLAIVSGIGLLFFNCAIHVHPVRVEFIFAFIALLFGCLNIVALPAESVRSWDDTVHYSHALSLSYVFDAEITQADYAVMFPLESHEIGHVYDGDLASPGRIWEQHNIDMYHSRLDADDAKAVIATMDGLAVATGGNLINLNTFGYIPSAIGLWAGRLLQLPFSIVYKMGEFANLISYIAVVFMAIRISPVKKILIASIALFPTIILMASSYSYDPWLISFLLLTFAAFLKERAHPASLLTVKSVVTLYALFFLSLAPKAVYFPLIGILFLMPKTKFSSNKGYRAYLVGTVILGIAVLLSFALPFILSSGSSVTDLRGGSDVSGPGQLSYILSHPAEAVIILGSYLANEYLTIPVSNSYILGTGYLTNADSGYISGIPILVLILVSIFDTARSRISQLNVGSRLWIMTTCLASMVLTALALYISYTPVGASMVSGLQPRYIIPVVFPVLLALTYQFPPFVPKYCEDRFTIVSLGFSSVLLGLSAWAGVISAIVI